MAYIKKKELDQLVGNNLNALFEEKGFKWKRSENKFTKYVEGGASIITYRILDSYDFTKDEVSWKIEFYFFIRFNIVHEWFETFEHRKKKDYKDSWTMGRNMEEINGVEFEIAVDESAISNRLSEINRKVFLDYNIFFKKYRTLSDVNNYLMPTPINSIEDVEKIHAFNMRTAMEYLTIAWILQRSDFELMLIAFKSKINDLAKVGDPMVNIYFPKFDEIIKTLKGTDFTNGIMKLDIIDD